MQVRNARGYRVGNSRAWHLSPASGQHGSGDRCQGTYPPLYPMPVRSRDYSGGDPPANRRRGSRAIVITRHAGYIDLPPRRGHVAVHRDLPKIGSRWPRRRHDGMSGSAARGRVQSFSSATSKLPPSRGASRTSVRARCTGRSIARDQSACRPAKPNDARHG
jgi:hypothetical protein